MQCTAPSTRPAFFGNGVGAPRPRRAVAARRAVDVRADSCLILNCTGGGHAPLGLHLAKKLLADGHSVTILNDGDPVSGGERHVARGTCVRLLYLAAGAAAAPRPPLHAWPAAAAVAAAGTRCTSARAPPTHPPATPTHRTHHTRRTS